MHQVADPLVPEVISSGKKQLSEMSYFIDTIKNTLKVLRESSKAKAPPSGPGYDRFLKCSLCYLGDSFQNGKIELSDDDRTTARDIEKHLSSKGHHKNVNEMRKPGYITCMICDCDIELSYDNFISENMIIPHLRDLDHEAHHTKVKSNIRKYVEIEPASYQLMPSEMGEMEHAVSSLSMKVGILEGSFSDFIKQQKARAEEERFNVSINQSQFHGPPVMESHHHHHHESHFDDAYPIKRTDPFNKPPVKRADHYNASSSNRDNHFNGPFVNGDGSFKNKHSKQFNSPAFNKQRSYHNHFPADYNPKRDMQQNYSAPQFNQQMRVSKFGPNKRPKRPHFWCNICMVPIMLEVDRNKVFKVLCSHMKGVKHSFNKENSGSKSKFFVCSVCRCNILMSHDHDSSLKNLDSHLDGITHIENFIQDEINFALE